MNVAASQDGIHSFHCYGRLHSRPDPLNAGKGEPAGDIVPTAGFATAIPDAEPPGKTRATFRETLTLERG